MSATIRAARACASTLLFHSLRLHAFQGAVPHVLVVVDRVPCVQQKAVVEGYVQVLRAYQQQGAAYLGTRHDDVLDCAMAEPDNTTAPHKSNEGELFISLKPDTETPCGSAGFTATAPSAPSLASANGADAGAAPTPLSYSVMPFDSEDFLEVVKRLQRFFRHCGDGQCSAHAAAPADAASITSATNTPALVAAPRWSEEKFAHEYAALCPLLGPLRASSGEPLEGESAVAEHDPESFDQVRCTALYTGPSRELLGCILVQQNAFQNEMKRYRLRLSLFDLGLRVAEHCHLLIMSTEADRLAAEGRYREALAEDQVYSYARSCAFRPEQAQTLAKAISDAIDLHSWRRAGGDASADGTAVHSASQPSPPPPPASFTEALHNDELRAIFNPGALHWGASTNSVTASSADHIDVEAVLHQPIYGPGVPLSIVSRDPAKVLTFSGGMEDCLTNTGYYVAAYVPARNDVARHRERFQLAMAADTDSVAVAAPAKAEAEAAATKDEQVSEAGSSTAGVHGRLKKKDYLASLKAKGQKPNKRHPDSDEDEDGALGRHGSSVPAGSCISNSIGGTFPIGEVISESFDLSQLNGTCDVFAYPDVFKKVTMSRPVPFTMTIERGVVTHISDGAPVEFVDLLSLVRQVEGDCYVRELGIGLNPYVGLSHVVSDVTTFERQWGIHISLGQRHPLFVKQRARCNADGSVATGVHVEGPVLKRKAGKYHIDVFVDAAQLTMRDVFSIDFTKGIAIP